jgi:hypothetical protein
MEDFQTIATFTFPHEIAVLKSILQNEGIAFLFQNENLIATNPFASFAYGGIILKVHKNDFEVVQQILNDLNNRMEIV